ncbi:MAG: ABC transporter permease subunit [Phycisphaerales bacterium]
MTHASGRRRTGRLVRVGDRAAGVVITLGGLAVLGSMLAICVFLFSSAAPLFQGGDAEPEPAVVTQVDRTPTSVVFDPTGAQAMLVAPSGHARVLDIDSGLMWGAVSLIAENASPRTVVVSPDTGDVSVGLEDGAFQAAGVRSSYALVADGDPPSAFASVEGDRADRFVRGARFADAAERAVAVEPAEGGVRVWEFAAERREPASLGEGLSGVAAIASRAVSSRERVTAAVLEDGRAFVASTRSVRRLDGRPGRERVSVTPLPIEVTPDRTTPGWVFLVGTSADVLMLWPDGWYERYAETEGDAWALAERDRAVEPGSWITAAAPALGGNAVLIGDDTGRVTSWRMTDGEDGAASRLTRSISVREGDSPVRSIGVGRRDRTVAVGFEDGSLVLENLTSGKRIAGWEGDGSAIVAAGVAPAVDAAVAVSENGMVRVWRLEPGHPEATWRSLFGRIPYEGYDEPTFVYQSTGSPGSEPKLSLTPLIWGTMKATIVAMLFAVPLAVLAAIYTSEFLHPSWRKTVKPTIELMASLPSVVLGFIAAILVAPYIAAWLPGVIMSMGVVPVAVLVGAGLWRMTPRGFRRRVPTAVLTALVILTILIGVGISSAVGGRVEALLFAADDGGASGLRGWLDSGAGSAWPGWFMAMIPPAAAVVLAAWWWLAVSKWNAFCDGLTPFGAGIAQLVLLAAQVIAALTLAAGAAGALTAIGLDPRDSIFGPFSQRNTLVVGVVMGVAVIPIIFTIADDALVAVPKSLRFASTGCGATAWQTATRVVLPVAGSGIFSACMIGLGRAVGETMIVLMATGNTPEMSLNIFGGFRTLAANIAVELPEAPRGGTHYRVLFLCGLVLFLMTLVINTTAELVRQRFRKRNAAL